MLLSTTGAAKVLEVHPDSIRAWADKGHIACYRTPGGWRRFRPEDIEAFTNKIREEAND